VAVVAGQRLKTVLRRGLRVACRSSESGRCDLTASISAREAKRLRLKVSGSKLVLGRASIVLPQAGTAARASLRLSARPARRLRQARRLTLSLSARVADAAANARRVGRVVRLR
jgi:hypothetical protein